MEAWWVRYPKAFQAEKEGLEAVGASWTIDDAEFSRGRLRIDIAHECGGVQHQLVAIYPDTYPYFMPSVFRDGEVFRRHQNPYGKNLCLLSRDGEDWEPGHDTLAGLLKEQFPQILTVNTTELSSPLVADLEDHVGEPFSSFLPHLANSVVIVPDETPAAEEKSGRLVLRLRPASSNLAEPMIVAGVIQTISDLAKKPLIEFFSIPPVFSQQMAGVWMRLEERPNLGGKVNPDAVRDFFVQALASKMPAFVKTIAHAKRGQLFVAGFVYRDEVAWRSNSDDWVFLAIRVLREAKGSRPVEVERQFIRADWGGEKAWMKRAPSLLPLRTKSALLIGLGSLGSPLCLHLARAGIKKLNVIDCDTLQVGNTVRWALGWKYAGMTKVSALTEHLAQEYPYTATHPHNVHIGSVDQLPGTSDYQLLRLLFEQSDLIIDASANHRVSHFLSDLARELRKPYLWLTTTHGAAGGIVGRIVPGKTAGCWHCFQHGLADQSIALPADSGAPAIQPGGCSQSTFIGAGIDSDEIALLGARLAVATLSNGEISGYPDFLHDVFVVDLNREAQSVAPGWKPYTLIKNPACTACNS